MTMATDTGERYRGGNGMAAEPAAPLAGLLRDRALRRAARRPQMATEAVLDRPDTGADDATGDGGTDPFDPALALVDRAIAGLAGRSVVAASEVVDRLLDVRSALTTEALLAAARLHAEA
jgi:hypothetical protein